MYFISCSQLANFYPDSLEHFATDIKDSVDVGTISTHLISHGLLTPEQQDDLIDPNLNSSKKRQKLCEILLRLNEECVKKFLQCLSETSSYSPHEQLLNKIRCKYHQCMDESLIRMQFGIYKSTNQLATWLAKSLTNLYVILQLASYFVQFIFRNYSQLATIDKFKFGNNVKCLANSQILLPFVCEVIVHYV